MSAVIVNWSSLSEPVNVISFPLSTICSTLISEGKTWSKALPNFSTVLASSTEYGFSALFP
ncbi:hypothetical protein ACM0L0_01520 [Mycoplasma sp. 005V]|uniref:hypothetical protein n=1 Tax=Mycoplasma sp. 005V TaxID=3398776 RepID=UPI003A83870A